MLVAAIAFSIAFATILLAHVFERWGYAPCPLCLQERYAYYFGVPALVVAAVGIVSLFVLGRDTRAVEFGEANAIDVESMGLYWHFVDIVWIIIFTVVYLLEYL